MLMLMNLVMIMLSALLAMSFYTLTERKFLGYFQYRKGPNKPNLSAIILPIADAMKLFSKEQKKITLSNMMFFMGSPLLMIILSLLMWPLSPNSNSMFFMKFSLIYFLCISSMSVYAMFMAGWSSNSKWGILGALRGVAQTISYEVIFSLIMICFIIYPMTTNIMFIYYNQTMWTLILLLPMSIMWFMSMLAETHRTPFDFAEGESELVSGYNIEYSNSLFAMIFMAEYMNIIFMSLITMSMMTSNLSNLELMMKTMLMSMIFIWSRATMPRLRYDMLMNTLWKKMLPVTLMLMMMLTSLLLLMKYL